MEISWNINKKRGNFRPVLTYEIALDDLEKELGIGPLKIDSKIVKPRNSWESHCFPGQNERDGIFDKETYEITTPSFKKNKISGKITLVWKESCKYPEVNNCFENVRSKMEEEILKAQNSFSINESGKIEFTKKFKLKSAPAAAAEMFLKAAI